MQPVQQMRCSAKTTIRTISALTGTHLPLGGEKHVVKCLAQGHKCKMLCKNSVWKSKPFFWQPLFVYVTNTSISISHRYYYDGDMIAKVHGKRFVYQFVCDLRSLLGYSAAELHERVTQCAKNKVKKAASMALNSEMRITWWGGHVPRIRQQYWMLVSIAQSRNQSIHQGSVTLMWNVCRTRWQTLDCLGWKENKI